MIEMLVVFEWMPGQDHFVILTDSLRDRRFFCFFMYLLDWSVDFVTILTELVSFLMVTKPPTRHQMKYAKCRRRRRLGWNGQSPRPNRISRIATGGMLGILGILGVPTGKRRPPADQRRNAEPPHVSGANATSKWSGRLIQRHRPLRRRNIGGRATNRPFQPSATYRPPNHNSRRNRRKKNRADGSIRPTDAQQRRQMPPHPANFKHRQRRNSTEKPKNRQFQPNGNTALET